MKAIDAAWVILKKSQEEWDDWSWDNACDDCGGMGFVEEQDANGEWQTPMCRSCNGTRYKTPVPPQYQQFHDKEHN
tara:strand:+ start:10161 stop:10388 length:228 start_codon:yes stop_codon:yes gene_type:complete